MLVLSMTALFFILGLTSLMQVDTQRRRAQAQADLLRAQSQAASGCRYAAFQLRTGAWGATRYQSPDLGGRFRLEVRSLGAGRFRIISTGVSGKMSYTREEVYPR